MERVCAQGQRCPGDPVAKATTVGASRPPRKTELLSKGLKQSASWDAAEACFVPTQTHTPRELAEKNRVPAPSSHRRADGTPRVHAPHSTPSAAASDAPDRAETEKLGKSKEKKTETRKIHSRQKA